MIQENAIREDAGVRSVAVESGIRAPCRADFRRGWIGLEAEPSSTSRPGLLPARPPAGCPFVVNHASASWRPATSRRPGETLMGAQI
jgi:hypothetical protein